MKVVVFIIGILTIGAGVIFLVLTQPYITYTTMRSSGEPTPIEVEYVNVTGDTLRSKLYVIAYGEVGEEAVFPNVPPGIPDPHDVEEIRDGDRLTLKGYPYQWAATNELTGTNRNHV